MTFDQRLTWKAVEERLAVEQDPVLRRNLETVLEHMRAEASLSVDRLMATMSENPHYHNWGGPAIPEIKGRAGVQKFYEIFARTGCDHIEHPAEYVVVDKHCVVTDGPTKILFPGRTLLKRGIEVDDPEAYYVYESRSLIIWPLDENGLLTGEDSYWGPDGFVGIADRKLDPSEIVPLTAEDLAPVGRFAK